MLLDVKDGSRILHKPTNIGVFAARTEDIPDRYFSSFLVSSVDFDAAESAGG